MRTASTLSLLVVLLLVASCGGSGGSTSSDGISEQDIIRELGLTPREGAGYELDGCGIAVVLNTPQEVELYSGAGDTVVTDPTGSFGVKAESEPHCVAMLEEALANLDR